MQNLRIIQNTIGIAFYSTIILLLLLLPLLHTNKQIDIKNGISLTVNTNTFFQMTTELKMQMQTNHQQFSLQIYS